MKYIALAFSLAACQSAAEQDAHPDAHTSSCHPQEGPLCTETCGNGVIDNCQSKRATEVCLDYVWTYEVCEGDSKSCTDLGYYAGTAPCTSCNYYSTFECDPCPPDAELCGPITGIGTAAASSANAVGTVTGGYLDVYDISGTTPVRSIHVPMADGAALTPVAGGWMVVSSTLDVTHVSDDGTVGNMTSITNTPSINVVAASYASGRVLVVWAATDIGTRAAIVDAANGSLVAGPFDVFTAADRPSVTTDGSAFFVGIRGKLAKILVDGTIAATTSIGMDPQYTAQVSCAGTMCWYVALQSPSTTMFTATAQRFDSDTLTVGAPVTIAPGFGLESFLSDGSDLLALRTTTGATGPHVQLVRIDGAGAVTAMKTIGAGVDERLLRVGSRVAILFPSVGKAYVAVTTP